jgi:hypothetical protein
MNSCGTKKPSAKNRAKLGFWAFVVAGGMLGIELVNTVRIWSNPISDRRFPFGYVSKGVWSVGVFGRPLDRDSNDFAAPLGAAYNVLRGREDPYRDLRVQEVSYLSEGFIYPPSAIVEMLPFAYWIRGDDLSTGIQLGDLVGRFCALGTIAVAVWFLARMVVSKRQWVAAVVILGAFFPLRWGLVCVNVQSFITFFMALLILAYSKRWNFLAGVMLGLGACLKPYLALLLLFAAFRKEWRFVMGAIFAASIMILASVAVAGIGPWRTYLFDMLPVMSRGYGYYANQSINGIAHRWLGHSTRVVLGPRSSIVSVATWISTVGFLGLSVCPRPIKRLRGDHPTRISSESAGLRSFAVPEDMLLRAADVAIALLAVTLASPILWEHYYGWCIVLFVVCVVISNLTQPSWWFHGLLAGSYVLLGTYLLSFRSVTSGPLTLINSPHFLGAVGLLGIAWHAQLGLYGMREPS